MYFVLYFIIIALYLALRNSKRTDRAKRTYIVMITLLLCTCTSLRNMAVGNDTYAYFLNFERMADEHVGDLVDNIFNTLDEVTNDQNKDPGYNLVAKFGNTVCLGSFEIYQFLIALLLLSAVGRLIYHYVSNFSGYIISYSFYVSLLYHWLPNSATRQTIALSLFLWAAIFWIEKKKLILPICCLLIGGTIHKSVLIGILPILLSFIPNKKHYISFTIILTLVLCVVGNKFTVFLSSIAASENYAFYAESDYYSRASKPIGFLVQIIFLFLISMMNAPDISKSPRMSQFVCINFYLAVVFAPLILVDPSLLRLDAYFLIWGIVYIPNIITYHKAFPKKWTYALLLLLLLGRPLILGNSPYKFNWESMELHQRFK